MKAKYKNLDRTLSDCIKYFLLINLFSYGSQMIVSLVSEICCSILFLPTDGHTGFPNMSCTFSL